jgi:hypothetical protein
MRKEAGKPGGSEAGKLKGPGERQLQFEVRGVRQKQGGIFF